MLALISTFFMFVKHTRYNVQQCNLSFFGLVFILENGITETLLDVSYSGT